MGHASRSAGPFSRRLVLSALAGIAVASGAYAFAEYVPLIGFLNFPGFLASMVLFARGHDFGPSYIVGGVAFNAAFYTGIFLFVQRVVGGRQR
jgi:hypothetical protein